MLNNSTFGVFVPVSVDLWVFYVWRMAVLVFLDFPL